MQKGTRQLCQHNGYRWRQQEEAVFLCQNKKWESSVVASLKKDGHTVGHARGEAEVLNSQYQSVFTKEDDSPLPDLGASSTQNAPNTHVGMNSVMKRLQGLKPHKSTGPGELSSRFLKVMASHHPSHQL